MRPQLLRRRGSWAVVSCLLTLCLFAHGVGAGFPLQVKPASLRVARVDITVIPSSLTVDVQDTFTVEIWVCPNGQQVDAVDADLTFDPTYLEVLSVSGDPSALPDELYSAFDNAVGTLTHSRGILVGTLPSTDFRLCSIELRARAVTDGTMLAFTGLTDAYFQGQGLLDSALGSTVEVIGWQLFLPIVLENAP
jgi:hypothetical protein